MTPEMKEKWIIALRSKAYEQSPGYLKKVVTDCTFSYCCLGVLLDVVEPTHWQVDRSEHDACVAHVHRDCDEELLDREFLSIAGIHHDWQRVLARLNDDGYPFDGIARIIENNDLAAAPEWYSPSALAYDDWMRLLPDKTPAKKATT